MVIVNSPLSELLRIRENAGSWVGTAASFGFKSNDVTCLLSPYVAL